MEATLDGNALLAITLVVYVLYLSWCRWLEYLASTKERK